MQAEQEARAAAEAQAEAARLAEAKDAHDAPGSPQREQGKIHAIAHVPRIALAVKIPIPTHLYDMYQYCVLAKCENHVNCKRLMITSPLCEAREKRFSFGSAITFRLRVWVTVSHTNTDIFVLNVYI